MDGAVAQKNDPRVLHGWVMYDWANSVYPLVITTTVFPIYFTSQAERAKVATDAGGRAIVEMFGWQVPATSLLMYAVSAAFVLVAAASPLLTALADASGRKKRFLRAFCWLGAGSCAGLFGFRAETLGLGLVLYVLATVGFAGSLVFYNSYLPDIATEDRADSLSARGFAYGYVGSSLLLVACLVMVLGAERLGMNADTAARLSFLLTAVWWAGFAQIPFTRLPADTGVPGGNGISLLAGYRQLGRIWRALRAHPLLHRYLASFFFASMGVQTVIYAATPFADEELRMGKEALILTVLILQFVGVAGAMAFAALSRRVGNLPALGTSVAVWGGICVAGCFVRAGWSFYALAACIGFAMGGVQSLARSTYSKLIPCDAHDSASWFAFFDVTEKLAIVLGTALFGVISQVSGSMRRSILALVFCFAAALALLWSMRKRGGGAGQSETKSGRTSG